MDNLKKTVSKNIIALRTAAHLTQYELGEKISYSDKTISKWERGDALPDVFVMKKLSQIFGVTVDYMLCEHSDEEHNAVSVQTDEFKSKLKATRVLITTIAVVGIWALATVLFVTFCLFFNPQWMIFAYALPVSLIVLLVFSSLWGSSKANFWIVSALVFSIIGCLYLSLLVYLDFNYWNIFLICIPAEIIIFLCFRLYSNIKKLKIEQ